MFYLDRQNFTGTGTGVALRTDKPPAADKIKFCMLKGLVYVLIAEVYIIEVCKELSTKLL
jgi:hypothetical protein